MCLILKDKYKSNSGKVGFLKHGLHIRRVAFCHWGKKKIYFKLKVSSVFKYINETLL